MTPLLLLDVDGVLNALSDELPDTSVWPRWQRGYAKTDGMTWPIVFALDVALAEASALLGHGADFWPALAESFDPGASVPDLIFLAQLLSSRSRSTRDMSAVASTVPDDRPSRGQSTTNVTTSTLLRSRVHEGLPAALSRGGAGNELFAQEADTAVTLFAGEVDGLLTQVAQAASHRDSICYEPERSDSPLSMLAGARCQAPPSS